MHKDPLVSIIVPVFNASSTIDKCLQTLLAQTMPDFEIILVNDGSTDASGLICNNYATLDNRVVCIHKTNGGVASARQAGLERVRGFYTIHADPDDWVESTMLEDLYSKAAEDNADMVICDYFIDYPSKTRYVSQKPLSYHPEEFIDDLFHSLHGSLWNKMLKTSCYTDNSISFLNNIDYCEDKLFIIKVLLNGVKNISYLPKAYYHYVQNPYSYTGNANPKWLTHYNAYQKEVTSLLHQCKKDYLLAQVHADKLIGIIKHPDASQEQFEEALREKIQWEYVTVSKPMKLLLGMTRILPLGFAQKVYQIFNYLSH